MHHFSYRKFTEINAPLIHHLQQESYNPYNPQNHFQVLSAGKNRLYFHEDREFGGVEGRWRQSTDGAAVFAVVWRKMLSGWSPKSAPLYGYNWKNYTTNACASFRKCNKQVNVSVPFVVRWDHSNQSQHTTAQPTKTRWKDISEQYRLPQTISHSHPITSPLTFPLWTIRTVPYKQNNREWGFYFYSW